MTLEDFISRFNSAELHLALKVLTLPNVGTDDDKINKLAMVGRNKPTIISLLSVLEEPRLREISLELGVSGAATMKQNKLMTRIALISLSEYETIGQQLDNITNLNSLLILTGVALVTMIIFIGSSLIFSTGIAFISALSITIPLGLYLFTKIRN